MTIKILSWNIWVDGYFDQISGFLEKSNADIVGLQEVEDDDSKHSMIKYPNDLGYYHAFASVRKEWGGKAYRDGPAIFSKFNISETKTYVLSKTESQVGLRTDIQIEDKMLHVFNTHLVHTHQEESEVQSEQALSLIKVLPSDLNIVMGDLNAIPDSQTIKNMKKVLVDSDSSSTPTWSVYPEGCGACNPQQVSMRLDYVFTSKDIIVESFEVGNSRGSDHLPISIKIEL